MTQILLMAVDDMVMLLNSSRNIRTQRSQLHGKQKVINMYIVCSKNSLGSM